MKWLCRFLGHKWLRCHCTRCGLAEHQWSGCSCPPCGANRHQWNGFLCGQCGASRTMDLFTPEFDRFWAARIKLLRTASRVDHSHGSSDVSGDSDASVGGHTDEDAARSHFLQVAYACVEQIVRTPNEMRAATQAVFDTAKRGEMSRSTSTTRDELVYRSADAAHDVWGTETTTVTDDLECPIAEGLREKIAEIRDRFDQLLAKSRDSG